MRFYQCDSLLNDVNDLFTDALHVALKPDVTMARIEELENRAEKSDPVSGEAHPKKELALKDLEVARSILQTGTSREVIQIDTSVSKAYDKHVTFSGGSPYPVLDLTKAKSEEERAELIGSYFDQIKERARQIEDLHNADSEKATSHAAISGKQYDEKNCILGATDIVLDKMMYSVAVKPFYAKLTEGGKSRDEAVKQLTDTLDTMDQMIDLFYQHKGLSDNPVIGEAAYGKDKMPSSRLNIRYQRMFAGAFMYAGGLHIRIEWDSVPVLAAAEPMVTDENGKYKSGQYFGWGISHEIGHIINEKIYTYPEVTNNYYA